MLRQVWWLDRRFMYVNFDDIFYAEVNVTERSIDLPFSISYLSFSFIMDLLRLN